MKFFLVTLLLIDTWGTLLALIVSKLKKETKNVDFMIKALLLDVDGTLLSFETHAVSQSSIDALRKAHDRGIKTKLAALFLTEHFFNIYNRRDRMFYDSGNLLDDRGKTIDKYPFIQLKSNSKIKLPCNLHCFLKILIRNRTSSYHSTVLWNNCIEWS